MRNILTIQIGDRFGRLVAIDIPYSAKNGRRVAMRCDCGTIVDRKVSKLSIIATPSCGCGIPTTSAAAGRSYKVHGLYKSPTYTSWRSMIQRCTNPKCDSYRNYGERGIQVCARWTENFQNFLDDMGLRPDGTTIDRIDNDGDYEPDNCQWAPMKAQRRNSRQNRYISIDGETKTLTEWSDLSGVSAPLIRQRIANGRSGLDILTPPAARRSPASPE